MGNFCSKNNETESNNQQSGTSPLLSESSNLTEQPTISQPTYSSNFGDPSISIYNKNKQHGKHPHQETKEESQLPKKNSSNQRQSVPLEKPAKPSINKQNSDHQDLSISIHNQINQNGPTSNIKPKESQLPKKNSSNQRQYVPLEKPAKPSINKHTSDHHDLSVSIPNNINQDGHNSDIKPKEESQLPKKKSSNQRQSLPPAEHSTRRQSILSEPFARNKKSKSWIENKKYDQAIVHKEPKPQSSKDKGAKITEPDQKSRNLKKNVGQEERSAIILESHSRFKEEQIEDRTSTDNAEHNHKVLSESVDKFKAIERKISELQKLIDVFNGPRKEKNYMNFNKILTNNLNQINNIETSADDALLSTQRNIINMIQLCTQKLEDKALSFEIKTIEIEVQKLEMNIDSFYGQREDKNYTYLHEMLNKNWNSINNNETGANDTLISTRKDSIKMMIQRCKQKLEDKALNFEIKTIDIELKKLEKDVDSFNGTREDKDYIYLREILNKNEKNLNNMKTGNNDIICNGIIKYIKGCLAKLEEKAANFEKDMEALKQVKSIEIDVKEIETEINSFEETREDENYISLHDLLKNNLTSLENICKHCKNDIILYKQSEINKTIQNCFTKLEEKASSAEKYIEAVKQLNSIEINVKEIDNEIDMFKGTCKDKYYIYLGETLTKDIHNINNIKTNNNVLVSSAKKNLTKYINTCLTKLEENALYNEVCQEQNEELISNRDDHEEPSEAIEQIKSIKMLVLQLEKEVENFKGTHKDPNYIYLNEMLIRHLLTIDNIESHDNNDIRSHKKDIIKLITLSIEKLEENGSSFADKMEPDITSELKEEKSPDNETAVQLAFKVIESTLPFDSASIGKKNIPDTSSALQEAREQIKSIEQDVMTLEKQVEGTSKDTNFIYLKEMLTHHLLKLDIIETHDNDDIRADRKGTIKFIHRCFDKLEEKTSPFKQNMIQTKPDEKEETTHGKRKFVHEEHHAKKQVLHSTFDQEQHSEEEEESMIQESEPMEPDIPSELKEERIPANETAVQSAFKVIEYSLPEVDSAYIWKKDIPGTSSSLQEAREQIKAIEKDAMTLEKEVDNFEGTSKDTNFMYLSEMLTSHLLKLDNIETHDNTDVRAVRKRTIKFIYSCLDKLEEKALNLEKNMIPTKAAETKEATHWKRKSDHEEHNAKKQVLHSTFDQEQHSEQEEESMIESEPMIQEESILQEESIDEIQSSVLNEALEKIKSVEMKVHKIEKDMDDFKGTSEDIAKMHSQVDEILTMHLVEIDNVNSQGNDNILTKKREVIKYIQCCINKVNALKLEESKLDIKVSTF